jgi:hypothetical protein
MTNAIVNNDSNSIESKFGAFLIREVTKSVFFADDIGSRRHGPEWQGCLRTSSFEKFAAGCFPNFCTERVRTRHLGFLKVRGLTLTLIRNGWNDSRSNGAPNGQQRGGFERSFSDTGRSAFSGGRGGGSWSGNNNPRQGGERGGGGNEPSFGFGVWKDGKHIAGGRNMRMEKEIFGDASDPSKQHTGINFEKYDDIPVEATGADVPEAVTAFTSPPLDPVLLENIGYARYTTPTPVQKYSIPIVANGRDLMACAQV